MKKRHSIRILLAAAALLLATAACTQDELADGDRLPEGQYPVEIARITLGVEGGEAQPWGAPQTRVGEAGDGTGSVFSAGDRFAVQIDGEEGIYIVQDNNTIKAESPLYWSDTGEHTVTAWYPATGGTLDLSNQSQSLAYLLGGSGTGNYQTPVMLTFAHRLAKVRVTPTGDALGEVQSLQLYTYTQCTYEKGTVVQGSQEGWIEMKRCEYTENGVSFTCWEANVVPGYTITKLMANNDNKERDLSSAITPEAGSYYNITLDKDKGYTDDGQGNYTVTSAEGLKNIAKLVNEERNLSIDITLTADIDLSGINWTPIGTSISNAYKGTFDGNGKTITGLTVTTSDRYAGLFGCIGSGGTVKNVTLKNVQITNDNSSGNAGGVAGWSYGNIENCSVSGSVSGSGMNGIAGGVVGFQVGGSLTGCSSSATVNAGNTAGGVAGSTMQAATLTACYATGDVTLESINQYYNFAGGVVGSNSSSSTLKACYAWGSVSGIGIGTIYTGGVTGTNDVGTLTACYHAKGTVKGSDGATGGVAGRNFKDSMLGSGIITACYWGGNGQEQGIGEDQVGTGGTTQVTDGNWSGAKDAMNKALENTGWHYELYNDGLPVLARTI
ncbi:GLUG motif-containing protein [uncultured Alistipes sp.]|uniref:GLUG motif-containing protein n=1 Tax=uncultured Alistipes sp. TaxID=538949 RepID=UPI00260774C5|nr:GLUG motif-containing protein [uncultured Alistipes sp.]